MAITVFLSYRRADTAEAAGWLYRELVQRLGEERVFLDREDIEHGANWRETVGAQLQAADVVLALIGPRWLHELHVRPDRSDDVLRFELATALARGQRVIPVLLDGASMPAAAELPLDLAPLADRHAATLSMADAQVQVQVRRLLLQVHVPWAVAPAWALANVGGAGVGAMLAVGLLMLVTDRPGVPSLAAGAQALQNLSHLPTYAAAAVAGALFGLCAGAGPWLVLRGWMLGLGWVVAAYGALSTAAALGLALSYLGPAPEWGLFFVPMLWYPALGLVLWAALRRRMSRAGWFAALHTALPALALLLGASSLSAALVGPEASLWNLVPVFLAHLANGVVLVGLMRRAGLQRR